jgi:hypothetical protein
MDSEKEAPRLDQNRQEGEVELIMYNTASLPSTPSLEQLAAGFART